MFVSVLISWKLRGFFLTFYTHFTITECVQHGVFPVFSCLQVGFAPIYTFPHYVDIICKTEQKTLMHRGPSEAARALYFTVSHKFCSFFANFASFLDDRKCLWSDVRVVPRINDPPGMFSTIHQNHEARRRYTSFFLKCWNVFFLYIFLYFIAFY